LFTYFLFDFLWVKFTIGCAIRDINTDRWKTYWEYHLIKRSWIAFEWWNKCNKPSRKSIVIKKLNGIG